MRAKAGELVLGFYHSHPDHPARPSEYDREHAWPFYSYVIVAIEQGRAGRDDVLVLNESTRAVSRNKRLNVASAWRDR